MCGNINDNNQNGGYRKHSAVLGTSTSNSTFLIPQTQSDMLNYAIKGLKERKG